MHTFFRAAAAIAATAFAAAAHAAGPNSSISLPGTPTGYSVVAAAGLADILAAN